MEAVAVECQGAPVEMSAGRRWRPAIEPSPSSESCIAVLLPCLNEEATIGVVVAGFQESLPGCVVHVYDNASTDDTTHVAAEAGAVVRYESSPGKGGVVRRMFAEVEAEVYVISDGDGTYDPAQAAVLVERLVSGGLDMVVGARIGIRQDAGRAGHAVGNRLFNRLYRWMFGTGFTDILSGYRAFSRRFVKSFPAVSTGFEIETEMSVHASQLRLPVAEVEVSYGARPDGSVSKLRTVADGTNILRAMLVLMKENRPMAFFGWVAGVFFTTALVLGVPLTVTFVQTGLVPRLPTAVLATGLALMGLLSVAVGLILESLAKGRLEAKRLAYLRHRPAHLQEDDSTEE